MNVERRLMTHDEMQAVDRMGPVTYPVASWDKRFMRSISSGEMISEKESAQLWRLFIKYRRQTGNFPDKPRLLAFAQEHSAVDFRKLKAQEDDKIRLAEYLDRYREAMNP